MMNNLFQKYGTLLILVLVLAAVGLGYAVYQQYGSQIVKTPGQNNGITASDYSPTGSLSEDEMKVLNTPGPNATEEQRRQHFLLTQQVAQEAEFLDITGCKAVPAVFKTNIGKTVQVKNQDDQKHVIILEKNNRAEVPANGTNAISVDFSRGRGVYGYGCDNSQTAVGMFFVEE